MYVYRHDKDIDTVLGGIFYRGLEVSSEVWGPLLAKVMSANSIWDWFRISDDFKRTATSSALAEIMASTPGHYPKMQGQLNMFVTVFPEFAERMVDTLVPRRDLVDNILLDSLFSMGYLTGDRIGKVALSLDRSSAIMEFCKIVGNDYVEKNFSQWIKAWAQIIKKDAGYYGDGVISVLPQACLPYLAKIHPQKLYVAWHFYMSIVRAKRDDILEDLQITAMLKLYWLSQKHPDYYRIRDIVLNHSFAIPESLVGEKLALILLFLNRFIDQSNKELKPKLVTNLPRDEDFKVRVFDLLLSNEKDMLNLYNKGLEALRELRSKLQYGTNVKNLAVKIMDSLGDPEIAMARIIAKAREVDDEELWKAIPGAFLLKEVGVGSYANETAACKLLPILRRHFPELGKPAGVLKGNSISMLEAKGLVEVQATSAE